MTSVIEYEDTIEELFLKEPDGRKKKEHKAWKEEINKLIAEVNKLAGTKLYSIVR